MLALRLAARGGGRWRGGGGRISGASSPELPSSSSSPSSSDESGPSVRVSGDSGGWSAATVAACAIAGADNRRCSVKREPTASANAPLGESARPVGDSSADDAGERGGEMTRDRTERRSCGAGRREPGSDRGIAERVTVRRARAADGWGLGR